MPDGMFDAILVVSTIEHIGLSAYGQLTLDDEGDLKAMKELYRILKPRGIIITTPYIGNCPLRVSSFGRDYNRQRLQKLVEGFRIVRDYFLRIIERKIYWERMSREDNQKSFVKPGLVFREKR